MTPHSQSRPIPIVHLNPKPRYMDPVNLAALIIAGIAFIIALLQVIQQYLSTAQARGKVNRASIGQWNKLNRYRWSFRHWQIRVEYLQPTLKIDNVLDSAHLGEQLILKDVINAFPSRLRQKYTFGVSLHIEKGTRGQLLTRIKIDITDSSGKAVSMLPKNLQGAKEHGEKRLQMLTKVASTHVKATWYNMMTDLVVDPLLLVEMERDSRKSAPSSSAPVSRASFTRQKKLFLLPGPGPLTLAQWKVLYDKPVPKKKEPEDPVLNSAVHVHYYQIPPNEYRSPASSDASKFTEEPAYVDAETVRSNLDNPILYIHASDLIKSALLLDMDPEGVDVREHKYDMRSQFCSLSSRVVHSPVVSYVGKPGHRYELRNCSATECRNVIHLAEGTLMVGSVVASIALWGYNAMDELFTTVIDQVTGPHWQQITDIRERVPGLEDDTHETWNGKWADPVTPFFPVLLGLSGSPTVANAFPRRLLSKWTPQARQMAAKKAYRLVEEDPSAGFIFSPRHLFSKMFGEQQDVDILVMSDGYKICNGWGSVYGGVRGWLVGDLTEFTYRMSQCWGRPEGCERYAVPMLSSLKSALKAGSLNRDWGLAYNQNRPDRGNTWRMHVNALLVLQLLLFDTWLASQADIMAGDGSCELTAPADVESAKKIKSLPEYEQRVTGWKRTRCQLTRDYLNRLADGLEGKGASCMGLNDETSSTSEDVEDSSSTTVIQDDKDVETLEKGWEGMRIGEPGQWARFDAVVTLRAVTMAARLELLKDSSVLLDCQEELDPLVQMI
ncbi:hypothetical protein D9758_016703 [Tetrapyrgos nigripes]|uniref:Uncharacterized protein n=1 Tax=Tetrapyrgos nigripes TaxID=182062 RepID=A0A8H5C8C2_9AGAR|nr:hypothetical protein D9758_016703 [Tetrapyrgos nigripes]